MPPDNITLNPANKRIDQTPSDFQIITGTTSYATVDTEQLIFPGLLWLMLLPLQGSNDGVIADSKVNELLTPILDILDNAVSEWVGNTTHILVYLLYSASREHNEVWAF